MFLIVYIKHPIEFLMFFFKLIRFALLMLHSIISIRGSSYFHFRLKNYILFRYFIQRCVVN